MMLNYISFIKNYKLITMPDYIWFINKFELNYLTIVGLYR